MPDPIPVLLLPGMDGTGDLFDPLLRALPPRFRPIVVRYPPDPTAGWDHHRDAALEAAPTEPFLVVGESFSGPVAWKLAATRPPSLLGVLQVGSFLRCPRPWLARVGVTLGRTLFVPRPPDRVIRTFLAGSDADDALVAATRAAMRSVGSRALARRLRLIRDVDAHLDARAWPGPAAALFGTDDRLVPAGVRAGLGAVLPQLEILETRAPHFIAQRRPDAVVDALDGLLGRAGG